jgi:hypothetical protein
VVKDMRKRADGEAHRPTSFAQFLPEAEHERVERLMAEKYRVDRIPVLPLYRPVTRLRGKAADASRSGAYLKLTPT